ncbi:MAG: hypothetical protein HHAS10_07420 [Candidatus Altimarinota bacterium]
MGQEYLALLAHCDPVIVVLYPDRLTTQGRLFLLNQPYLMNRTLLTFFQTEILKKKIFFIFLFGKYHFFPLPVRFRVITKNKKKKSFEKIIKVSYQKILPFNFSYMNQETKLQSITLEDINTNTITKHTGSDGFDGSSFIGIGLLFLFLIYMLHDGSNNSNTSSSSKPSNQNKKGIKLDNNEKKLSDKVRALEMTLKNLELKKREAEGEIRKIEMNSLSQTDTEATYDNEFKIDKLTMKIEEIEMMIEKKNEELEDAKIKLEQYQNENYL